MSAGNLDAPNTAPVPYSIIHDIPPETLIQICSINTYRDWTPFSANPYNDTSTEFSLPAAISDTIRASHVCRRWRNILISAPELWTNMVDPYDVEWTRIILERSRPLGIRLAPPRGERHYSQTGEDFKTETASQEILERLLEYHFTQDADDRGLSLMDSMAHIKFPQLQFLYLDLSPSQPLSKKFPGFKTTPVLKHLYIRRTFFYRVKQLGSVSATLTHLTVVDLDPVGRVPSHEMAAIVNRLHMLQSVTLRKALSRLPPQDPVTPKPIHVSDISLEDETDLLSFFFQCAEFSQPLHRVSLHCGMLRCYRSLDHLVFTAANIFNIFCSSNEFKEYRLLIGPGEITYTSMLDSNPSDSRSEERKFHFHLSLMEFPSFNFDRMFSTFLPTWLYDQVEYLTIPFPVFNLLYGELGEEIVVEILRRFSNVRVLDGVGPVLWDLLYRWAQPLDGDVRVVLPSLREIVFHRDCIPTVPAALETTDDRCASVSDSTSEKLGEDVEEGNGDFAITVLVSTQELFPESDSEDGSFVYESGHSNYSDFEDSTGLPEHFGPPAISHPAYRWTSILPYYRDEYTDVRQEYIDNSEILQFCSSRLAVRRIVISSPAVADDKNFNALRMALQEVGVSVDTLSSPMGS